jgi:hypothetical protein
VFDAILPRHLPARWIGLPVRGALLLKHRSAVRIGQHMVMVVQSQPAAAQRFKTVQYRLKFKHN